MKDYSHKTTYDFDVKGRNEREVNEMKEYGYVEREQYAKASLRNDGYFCGTCKWFERKPHTMPVKPSFHDGYCMRFAFRDTDYGCCGGWEPKPEKLFSNG